MKLAEALMIRADLQKEIHGMERRILANVKGQEDDEPVEDVEKLLPQYAALMETLESLIVKINNTNSATVFGDTTLSAAITRRDSLKKRIGVYRDIYTTAVEREGRYSRSEIKYVRYVDAKKIRFMIDGLSKDLRELDIGIQSFNWTVDLME